jgi:2-iminobutanoate/2-iminopropanoate deaminase
MKRDFPHIISTKAAPQAIGPYSQAVRSGDLVFCAGALGISPQSGELVGGGIESETQQALTNLGHILESAGSSLRLVLKTTVFLRQIGDFARMNAVYATFFPSNPPARTTVQVAALPKNAAVEIEAVARVT